MRLAFILFVFIFTSVFPSYSLGENPSYTYSLPQVIEKPINISDSISIVFESGKTYRIEEIIALPDSVFSPLNSNFSETETAPSFWAKIRLKNPNSQTYSGFFNFCQYMNSVHLYALTNGKVVENQLTGMNIPPPDKPFVSAYNYLPFTVEAASERTYFFKIHFEIAALQKAHLKHLYLTNDQKTHYSRLSGYSWYSFYAGMMILFSLVSLFMFVIFKERVFIYFALLTFFFVLYFLSDTVAYTFLTYRFSIHHTKLFTIAIAGLVFSLSMFVASYIHLKKYYPRFHRYFFIYTSLLVLCLLGMPFLELPQLQQMLEISNLLILVWIIMIVISIFLVRQQKDKSAQIMLVSIGVLSLSSFIYILYLLFETEGGNWAVRMLRYSFQVGTILFSSILFYGLFDKVNTIRNEKRRFEELDHLKSRFFANISHEFRTPLTLILGPIQQLSQKQKNKEDKKMLQMAHLNAERLLQLINQLLDLSKLETGKMTLKANKQNIVALLKGITMSFESLADRKNIRLHFASQKDAVELYVDRDKIEKIFYNLLSNALKFTEEQGEVVVLVTDQKETIEVQVKDSGIGIAASKLPHIFNRFFQAEDAHTTEQEGTGIGLALVKELVQLHKANIEVKSQKGKGTIFTLSFLKGFKHLKESEIFEETTSQGIEQAPIKEPVFWMPDIAQESAAISPKNNFFPSNNLPTVLIIEDHADVRAYIKQYLIQSFQILEAINGQDGIEKALEFIPDLIISDVMMPKKNGYEVCQILKTDQRTSHIPIILLTAKAAQEEKLEGLETGADDYLVKPFDTKELEVRVRNLIEVRRQLRKRFSEAPKIEPKAVQTNSLDQAFLEKVIAVIEKHLSNEQFGVEVLVKEVGMSRSQLNRKLKAITDQSSNKLIRNLRLQKAHEMLQQKMGNVSEIAFETGFSSTSYFVKCFRDKYGQTPGSLLNN